MAWTAHKDEKQIKEHFEDEKSLDEKLTEWIKNSKHLVVFTGAGISTSAGIPDFRGPQGVWTLQATGGMRTEKTVSSTQVLCVYILALRAMPTVTHMSLVKLQQEGILKYIISQNCDGLHRRSGILPDKLHGNSNLERCKDCAKEYLRDFRATASYRTSVHDHRTGRKCDACGGELHDSIINFGENLPEVPLTKGRKNSKKSDVFLVLGSSLTVSPACHMPEQAAKRGAKLIIVNLQDTPLDELASLRIYGKTDQVMQAVMQKLKLEIPPFMLQRTLAIDHITKKSLAFRGIDTDGTPVTFVQTVTGQLTAPKKWLFSNTKSFQLKLEENPKMKLEFDSQYETVSIKLSFMGHYHEPDLSLTFPMATEDCTTEYCLHYNPLTGFWNVTLPKSSVFHIEKNSDNNFIVVSKSTLNVNTSEEAPKLATPKQEGVVVEKSEAMEILPAMDVLETKDYEILIGNEHEKIDSETKNSHRWTVFVRASDPNFNLKDIVEKVDFELHPTFFPARVAVFESPFQVERIGWGIFTVPVKICFKNGKTVSFEHQLSFQNDVTQVVHTVKV